MMAVRVSVVRQGGTLAARMPDSRRPAPFLMLIRKDANLDLREEP